jgi:hypothetical protein
MADLITGPFYPRVKPGDRDADLDPSDRITQRDRPTPAMIESPAV